MQPWDGFLLETWRFLCRVAKIVVRDAPCSWVSPVHGVERTDLLFPHQTSLFCACLGGTSVALKLVALAGQDAQSQCKNMVLVSSRTFCLTHCLVKPGTAPPRYTLCKTCSLKHFHIGQIPRRYKSLLKAKQPWDLCQPQIGLVEPKGRQMNCDCWF